MLASAAAIRTALFPGPANIQRRPLLGRNIHMHHKMEVALRNFPAHLDSDYYLQLLHQVLPRQ